MNITQLGAFELARAFANATLTAQEIVGAHLARIEEANDELQAFVAIDPKLSLKQAKALDRNRSQLVGKPLAGVPFAVKDVLDSRDFPTAYGSPIYTTHRPVLDAACLLSAERHGGIMMGKVATGEFATQTPSAARNPLNPDHTPGGSSSGSATAVAANMVPVAFGTQTTGSIVRPAVFCGLVGYKPTFGLIGTGGLKTLSHTQDTIGVITRSVGDASFFTLGMLGAQHVAQSTGTPRLALCISRQWDYLDEETILAIQTLERQLQKAGVTVDRVRLPAELEHLTALQPRLFQFEALQNLANEKRRNHDQLSPRLQARLAAAESVTFDEYLSARKLIIAGQRILSDLLDGYDSLLYPAAAGEAPKGLQAAGDPRFGALWSLLGAPSLSLPIANGSQGLPLGVQLIADAGSDIQVLQAGLFLESVIKHAH